MHVDIDAEMQAALRDNDHVKCVRLYMQAATAAEAADNEDEACFFLTQAWILSLQFNLPEHSDLQARLLAYGRL